MKLTEEERTFIARRAAGEFAIIPAVTRIVHAHKKNRNPDDQVFLEFARLTLKKSWVWDEYYELAQKVLDIIPHPFGLPWWMKDSEPAVEVKPKKRRKPARKKQSRDDQPPGDPAVDGLMDLLGY